MADDSQAIQFHLFIYYSVSGTAAAFALVLYEHIITVDQEVACIWRRKFNAASVLFIVNRYGVLAEAVINLLQYFQAESFQACNALSIVSSIVVMGTQLASAVFFLLRIWAIWGRHWLPLILLTPLAACIVISTSIYNFSLKALESLPLPLPYGSCQLQFSGLPSAAFEILILTADATLVTIVLLALVATLMKTIGIKRTSDAAGMGQTLSSLLMRDGSVYLLVITIIESLDITQRVAGYTTTIPEASAIELGFATIISPIFVARFILGLREFDTVGHPSQTNTLRISAIEFMGNIGAPLSQSYIATVDNGDIPEEDHPDIPPLTVDILEDLSDPLALGLFPPQGQRSVVPTNTDQV